MKLKDLIEDAGYEVRAYAGRGMGGQECLATDPGPNVVEFVVDLMVAYDGEEVEGLLELVEGPLRGAKVDSMGQGRVMYFPDVPYED